MKPLLLTIHVVTLALLVWSILRLDSVDKSVAKTSVQIDVVQQQVDGIARDVALLRDKAQ
jgi:uncharacterized protein YoxC